MALQVWFGIPNKKVPNTKIVGKVGGGVGGTLIYHLVPTVLRHITKSLNRAGLRILRVDLRRFNIL